MLNEGFHSCLNRAHLLNDFCQRLCAGRLLAAKIGEELENNILLAERGRAATYPLFGELSPFDASAVLELLLSPLDVCGVCDGVAVPVAVDSDDEVAAALGVETFIEMGFELTPRTRTLDCAPFPLGLATNSMVGADAELNTSGIVA